MQLKYCSYRLLAFLLASPVLFLLTPSATLATPKDAFAQVTSVSQLSDVQPTDWAFQALQSLVERYGCIEGYPERTYRGNRAMTRYEFAAGLNACLDRIRELIGTGTTNLVTQEDLATLQRLQAEFTTELATLRGRVDTLEARTAQLEANQFSATTKLNAEIIVAVTDTFGDRVGGGGDRTNTIVANRGRLNLETSFTGRDLLRTRLEFGNFGNNIAEQTGTNMTRLNFDGNENNDVTIPHLLYITPITSNLSVTFGTVGIGYTDITNTLTPPTIASDSLGIPSKFGEYSPLYRRGGGGGAINWNISKDLILTLGYLVPDVNIPTPKNGLFNGSYHALAQLAYYRDWGAIGVAYSRSYAPGGEVDLSASTGSFLASGPFGDNIATSSDSVGIQGFYHFSPHFQVHGWGVYTRANAESSGMSNVSNGRGSADVLNVDRGANADVLYGAIGFSFPDVGGEGNLPGILVGLPPRVTSSDVRDEPDTSYHIEAFYRFQVNDNISITPGFWVVINPENDSYNDTQWVGLVRTSFNF
ncbi:carbohydrate porin [Planktothrix sp. FACHB-1355]|uniref:Carbohydrate porin n=1 Tax=Aerosakkonema funiforme FACHB-1375 TaxID=2949571 RepID=A0A926ZGM7_9CYAN|nr:MULTISPECIES: iron uptake porin [Oscillatoriales]MBD2179976.1 carbohydrate porin [Aerosakkonema funiforme FACHB-1375]MBD3561907.1 carbohydrate porin [Planktothrix sp. FACHB-1355]